MLVSMTLPPQILVVTMNLLSRLYNSSIFLIFLNAGYDMQVMEKQVQSRVDLVEKVLSIIGVVQKAGHVVG